jgi:threonine aldolase
VSPPCDTPAPCRRASPAVRASLVHAALDLARPPPPGRRSFLPAALSAIVTSPAHHFASDNAAGIHPEVLAAIAAANEGHALAYGADRWTAAALSLFRAEFGDDSEAFLVFGGTGANVVGLDALLHPWESVLCATAAHVNVDECGAPERFLGCKLVPLAAPDGKLHPDVIRAALTGVGVEHHVQPRVISISQSSEYGTVYRPEEIRALSSLAREHGLLLHMDGARLSNAAAALDIPLRALTTDVGVDVLSFGGTKNGAMGAEAVIFFDRSRAAGVRFGRKQAMQLPSKMRFVAAQFEALLRDGLWRRNAAHANRMAQSLAERVAAVPGVVITQPVDANAVFARVAGERFAALQSRQPRNVWDEPRAEMRWMCAFDTTNGDVDTLTAELCGNDA